MKSIFIKKTIITPLNFISILLLIVCIVCIVCIIYIICNPKIERFKESIGDNQYLEPSDDEISDEMWNILVNKLNKVNKTTDFNFDKIKKEYTTFITKDEINDYLKNDSFQWSNYVRNKYKEMLPPDSTDEQIDENMKYYPNRYAYYQYILSPNMKEDLKSSAYIKYSTPKPTKAK